MGFLNRILGGAVHTTHDLTGEVEVIVVGDEYYDGLRGLRMGSKHVFELRREPQNRHDRNAVAVWVAGKQVGYLSAFRAESYAKMLDALGPGVIRAHGHVRKAGVHKAAFVMMPKPAKGRR